MEKIKYFANKPSAVLVREESTFTELNATENGEYVPEGYDGYSKVTVDVFSPTLETLNATANQTYTAPTGKAYDEVVVNVPAPVPDLITKTITANGTYTASQDSAEGYSSVTVNVPAPTLNAPGNANEGNRGRTASVDPNRNYNGLFPKKYIWKIGNDTIEVKKVDISSNTSAWYYQLMPIEGGTMNAEVRLVADGFAASSPTSISIVYAPATETNGYCSIAGLGDSDIHTQTYTYDPNFPRTFQEVQDTYGNVFIKIPTIYRKILASSNGQITSYALATSALDSDYKPYPCFVDETNSNAILPYVLIGKYCVSSTTAANSVDASAVGSNIATFRTLCRARGTGYQQYDWKFQKLFVDLGLVISRMINIGNGAFFPEILGIENQDLTVFVDGVMKGAYDSGYSWYIAEAEANYWSSNITNVTESDILSHGYSKLSYVSPQGTVYITKLGYDSDYPFCNFPVEDTGVTGSASKYYCDQIYAGSGNMMVTSSVGYGSPSNGWFYCGANINIAGYKYARLCYRPILGATGYTE